MKRLCSASALAMAFFLAGQAHAQEPATQSDDGQEPASQNDNGEEPASQNDGGFNEIVVTATKSGETALQTTPIAATAFTTETLDRGGISDIRDLAPATPNMSIAENTGFSQVYIRGIGSNNVFAGSDPSSTIHLDGVYLARPASYFGNFLDVERIEILRGPQGTLYGRNSVGGTINIISRKPDNDVQAKAQVTAGNYNAFGLEGYLSGPLVTDKLAASISVLRAGHDGYQRNVAPTGVRRADDADMFAVRGQLRFTPTDTVDIIARGDYTRANEIPGGYLKTLLPTPAAPSPRHDPIADSILGDYRKIATDVDLSTRKRAWGAALDISVDLGDDIVLSSLTAHRTNEFSFVLDSDATAARVVVNNLFENQNQFSEELTLRGQFGRLSIVSGAYYFQERIRAFQFLDNFLLGIQPNPNVLVRTRALAAYAQATFAITDTISVTAGARYTDERKRFDQTFVIRSLATGLPLPGFPTGYNLVGRYKLTTPKFGIDYTPNRNVFIYASATRGAKSGGFNYTMPTIHAGFAPESLWSYEVGAKTNWFGNRMLLNITAFKYDYTDLQVQAFITLGVIDITNAADATVKGVELELQTRPVPGLEIGGNLAYLDAYYTRYPGAPTGDATGNQLSSAPKWAPMVYGQYRAELANGASILLRGEYTHRSRQYFTPANVAAQSQAGYGLLNANLGYTSPSRRWQVVIYGRNLADTQYVTTTASFPSAISGRVGEPRTFGVKATFQY